LPATGKLGSGAKDKDKFAPICPEFVIEVKSKSDSIDDLTNKMKVWIANRVTLGRLIDMKIKFISTGRADQKSV